MAKCCLCSSLFSIIFFMLVEKSTTKIYSLGVVVSTLPKYTLSLSYFENRFSDTSNFLRDYCIFLRRIGW